VAQRLGGEAWVVDLSATEALDDLSLDADILVNNAGVQTVAPITEVLAGPLPVHAPAHGRIALPSHPGRARDVRARLGSHHQHLQCAWPPRKRVQVGLRDGQTRPGGAVEGDGAGGRAARGDQQLHQPRVCAHALVEKQIADQASVHGIAEDDVVEKIMLTESVIKRLIEPTEVASLAGWLASDHAGMVTGASYTMDGGWTAR
jgi:3-hydroxybutyrate dehydrogenase